MMLLLVKGNSKMNVLKTNAIYKHFKGDYYLVIDVAIHSETKEKYVIYKALYGNCDIYIRPLDMFLSEVDHQKYPNISQKYRFELQEIASVKEKKENENEQS